MAVAFLNTNTNAFATASPVSVPMTVNSGGSNVVAFFEVAYDNNAGMSISAVKYGGQSLTQAGTPAHNTTSNAYSEIWYLVNPPRGSNTLQFTVGGTITDIYFNLVSFQNVNQGTPVRPGTYTSATGNTASPTLTVTSNTNDLTISCTDSGGNATASGTNQTSDGIDSNGGFGAGTDHATTAASSITHIWTQGLSTNWVIAGLSINGSFPSISSQPSNQTTLIGNTATFNITGVTSGGVLHYQWHSNGVNVGTDSSTYTTSAATSSDNLSAIYCTVTDDNGSADSLHVYWLVISSTVIW